VIPGVLILWAAALKVSLALLFFVCLVWAPLVLYRLFQSVWPDRRAVFGWYLAGVVASLAETGRHEQL
jgi:hypothetical protein